MGYYSRVSPLDNGPLERFQSNDYLTFHKTFTFHYSYLGTFRRAKREFSAYWGLNTDFCHYLQNKDIYFIAS